MRALSFLIGLGVAAGGVAVLAQGQRVAEIPDPDLTPGLVASADTREVCTVERGATYSQRHRQTSIELKRAIMAAYSQVPGHAGDGEVDHLVPLCLGGADSKQNLWWQPGRGHGARFTYHEKDRLEAAACRLACSGQVSLVDTQLWFMPPADWRDAYCRIIGGPPC